MLFNWLYSLWGLEVVVALQFKNTDIRQVDEDVNKCVLVEGCFKGSKIVLL
jgi:hypothetical protein